MRKRAIPNTTCRICGKPFHVKPSLLKQGFGKYCSRECQNKSQEKGRYVACSYCGKQIYKPLVELRKKSKTNTYFCNKSCQCAWKNKQRKGKKRFKSLKKLWGSWCNSSTRICGVLGTDANSVGPPFFFLKFLKLGQKKTNPSFFKRPSKKILYNLYWKKNHGQSEIAKIFNATHTSVKRWLNYYHIPVKPRTLTCGRNPNSLKCLELGKTPESERKSAEARRIYSKEKLIQKIKEFVKEHGRIPTNPDYTTYRDYFGTWNNAIKTTGYKPNEPWFSPKDCSRSLSAKDGHLCNSISEIIIDDWLFENNIPHKREYLYPEGQYRCDFVIENIFIEFFGLANTTSIDLKYPAIMKKKKLLCKKYKIPLIDLYENDLYNLDQSLGGKLDKIKAKSSIPPFRNFVNHLSKIQIKFF